MKAFDWRHRRHKDASDLAPTMAMKPDASMHPVHTTTAARPSPIAGPLGFIKGMFEDLQVLIVVVLIVSAFISIIQ